MTTCDPATLIAQAKCFTCLDRKQSDAAQVYLLCLKAGGGLPAGEMYLTDDQGNYILDDQGNRIVVQI